MTTGSVVWQAGSSSVERVLPAQAGRGGELRVFASPRLPLSPQELRDLEAVSRLDGVAYAAALPDLHVKPNLETPSSLATAVRGAVVLGLSSPSPGCGMALARTDLGEDDLSAGRLDQFFGCLAARLPVERSAPPDGWRDIRPALLQGAAPALKAYDLDPALLDATERRGDALAELGEWLDPQEALRFLPEEVLPLAQREFGMVGRGNHFLEVQVVDQVLDAPTAGRWGLQAGQVVVMYHADSGRMGALTGRLYAHRRKNTPRGRLVELQVKAPFHLRQAGSLRDFTHRAADYFWPRRHTPLDSGSPNARRALGALALASNYAYANRVAVLAAIRDGLRAAWGEALGSPELVWDSSHNTIRPEWVQGERLWVHRHNANRALPAWRVELAGGPFFSTGQPVLLPGVNRTASYLCAAQLGVRRSLDTVDHGAGRSALRLARPAPDSPARTRLYTGPGQFTRLLPHLTDDGVEAVLEVLAAADLARPVARLRPVAVWKHAVSEAGAVMEAV